MTYLLGRAIRRRQLPNKDDRLRVPGPEKPTAGEFQLQLGLPKSCVVDRPNLVRVFDREQGCAFCGWKPYYFYYCKGCVARQEAHMTCNCEKCFARWFEACACDAELFKEQQREA